MSEAASWRPEGMSEAAFWQMPVCRVRCAGRMLRLAALATVCLLSADAHSSGARPAERLSLPATARGVGRVKLKSSGVAQPTSATNARHQQLDEGGDEAKEGVKTAGKSARLDPANFVVVIVAALILIYCCYRALHPPFLDVEKMYIKYINT